jgi:hypothetical protein
MKRLIIIAAIVLMATSAGAKKKITQADLDAANLRAAQAVGLALTSKAETMQLQYVELQKRIQKNVLEIKRLTPPKPKEKKKGKK